MSSPELIDEFDLSGDENLLSGFFEKPKEQPEVFLLASFDLVNSTALKEIHERWWDVIDSFYEISVSTIKTESEPKKLAPSVLKYIGDEVIWYFPISNVIELRDAVSVLARSLHLVVDELYQKHPQDHKYLKKFISVKGTAWLVPAKTVGKDQKMDEEDNETGRQFRNVRTKKIYINDDRLLADSTDFLGPDVDIGFRISKYSDKYKMTLSANLALCLLRGGVLNGHFMKIVGFESLRGVWQGRPYPIVWYYEKSEELPDIKDTFYYDEKIGLIHNEFHKQAVQSVLQDKCHDIGLLKTIYKDLNRSEEIDVLMGLLGAKAS